MLGDLAPGELPPGRFGFRCWLRSVMVGFDVGRPVGRRIARRRKRVSRPNCQLAMALAFPFGSLLKEPKSLPPSKFAPL